MDQRRITVIPFNSELQENWNQKTENILLPLKFQQKLSKNEQIVILNERVKEIALCTVTDITETNGVFHIDENVHLPKKFQLERGVGVNIKNKIFDFNKATHLQRRQIILTSIRPETKLYNFFTSDDEEEGCIAYKHLKIWGFLYYTKKDKQFTFRFEPVDNRRDDKKLLPTDDGYRDFVYFLRAEAIPKAYKIGRAENPDNRLAQIDGANHREVKRLLVLPDGRMEPVYHSKYDIYRISKKKEWFEMADELTEFIDTEMQKTKHIVRLYQNFIKGAGDAGN